MGFASLYPSYALRASSSSECSHSLGRKQNSFGQEPHVRGVAPWTMQALLSPLRSKLAKEAPVITAHPFLDETPFIVEPEDV
jgi:hypothetical protein